ncbi:MAG: Tat pathway signal sequence domain protein [Caulobacterales bacterium]|nr:Tat pathway signal sequence domain protein [Caulobacterales bacterium]
MRRPFALVVSALALFAVATPALAQLGPQDDDNRTRRERDQRDQEFNATPAPLRERPNAGPCPFVRILYDAARYVEFEGGQQTYSAVGYTGEIEGVEAECVYREADPIRIDMNILFHLGRGPQATDGQRTYRYWVAVTERNSAILAKEYFDLPVNFNGDDRTYVTEEIRGLTIPRRDITVSGSNFEVLVGFEVTPEMAEFNRNGARFRANAGAPSE